MNRINDGIGWAITIGLFLVMAGSTLAFGTVEPWSIALFGVSVAGLLLLWAVRSAVLGRLTVRVPLTALPLAALLIYGIVQGLSYSDGTSGRRGLSMDLEATRLAVELIAVLLIVSLVAANILEDRARLSALVDFLIFFGLALAVFGLVQRFTWNGKYYWMIEPSVPPSSPFGPFVNHNHFAGYVEMIVPLPMALVMTRAVKGERALLYGFAAVMMGVSVIASLSRGGMISLLSGLVLVILLGLRAAAMKEGASRRITAPSLRIPAFLSRIAVPAIVVATIGVGVWWVGADSVVSRVERMDLSMEGKSKDPGRETFYQSRGWIWRDTMAMIRDHWKTGVGLGAYPTVYPRYNERNGLLQVKQAHNDYLQIMADCGIIGAALALCFVVLAVRDLLRSLRHPDRKAAAIALGCGGGMLAMFVHSLFDFNLQLPSNALLFMVLIVVISNLSWSAIQRSSLKAGQAEQAGFDRDSRVRDDAQELEVYS